MIAAQGITGRVEIRTSDGDQRDVFGWLIAGTIRRGYEGGAMLRFKVDQHNDETWRFFQKIRYGDWVKVFLQRDEPQLQVPFLGMVSGVDWDETVGQSGVVTWSYTIRAEAWGDVLLTTPVIMPVSSKRLPGTVPVALWADGYQKRSETIIMQGNLTGFVQNVLNDLLKGLYPDAAKLIDPKGADLIGVVSWKLSEKVTGLSFDTLSFYAPQISIAELLASFLSEDLHEFFCDYEILNDAGDFVPAVIFRRHPLVRAKEWRGEAIDITANIRGATFGRNGGERATVWYPGGLLRSSVASGYVGDYGTDTQIPIIEEGLLSRYSARTRPAKDPILASVGFGDDEKTVSADLLQQCVDRLKQGREAHYYDDERLLCSISLVPAVEVRPGQGYKFTVRRPVMMREIAKDGQFKFRETDVLIGYCRGVTHSLRVTNAGLLTSQSDVDLAHCEPESSLVVPGIRRVQAPMVIVPRYTSEMILLSGDGATAGTGGYKIRHVLDEKFSRGGPRDLSKGLYGIVVHHSGADGIDATIRALQSRSVSTHFVIDWGGEIYQLLAVSDIAYHAGGFNQWSVGIDLVGGYVGSFAGKGAGGVRKPFTQQQVEALAALVKSLIRAKYNGQSIVVESAKRTYPYRKWAKEAKERQDIWAWWAEQGLIKPFRDKTQGGIFAHNQLDPAKPDPCYAPTDWSEMGQFWDNKVRVALAFAFGST
jgi:hypothetical protein